MKQKSLLLVLALVLVFVMTSAVACNPHEHTWTDWKLTTPPTETSTGTATRTCECGETESKTDVPVLTDTSVWTMTETPATHESEGSKVYTSEYGTVTISIPKGEHTYGAWTITTKPTMEATGLAKHTCECGHEETAVLPVLSDTSVWTVKSTTPSTCTVAGNTVYTSAYGEVTVELPLLDHVYGAWTITDEPTMEATGLAKRTCECGHEDTAVLAVLSDTSVWTAKTVAADYNNGSVSTYTSVYGTVVVNGNDKLVAPYDGKTYSSVYIDTDGKLYGSQTIGVSWNSALLTVDNNGVASNTAHPWQGTGQFVMIDPTTGKFEIRWEEGITTVGYVDMETGVFVFPYDTTYDYFHIAVPSDVEVSGSLFTACVIDGAVAVQYSNGEVVSNIFTRNNNVYMGATFESDDEAATVGQLFECKTVTVKDKSGKVIVTYVEDSEGNLVVADGVQGVYEGDLGTMTLSGSGNVTFDNGGVISSGTYELYESGIGVYVDGKYYDVTLSGETYTAIATEVSITFNINGVTPAEEFVESVSVNKNIEYSLPVYTNETMQFKGWFYDMYCTEPVESPFIPTVDVELFASWAPKVVINLEGVLEGDDNQLLLGAGDIIGEYLPDYVLNETLNDDGTKYFGGWYLDAEFTTAVYEDAPLEEIYSGIIIYAKWIDTPAWYGEFYGTEIWSESSGNNTDYHAFIDLDGNITSDISRNSFNGAVVVGYDPVTQILQYQKTGESTVYTAYLDAETGILAGIYEENVTDDDLYVMSKAATATEYKLASSYGVNSAKEPGSSTRGYYAQFVTLNTLLGERNVLIYNNFIYSNITLTDALGNELAVSEIVNSKTVVVRNAETQEIILAVASQGTSFDVNTSTIDLDQYFGTYVNESMGDLVLDGAGNFTWGEKSGTYQLMEGNNFAMYVVADGANSEYWEVTLADGAYTATKPEVTITFEVVGPEGATEVMEAMTVNKNIAVQLPDGSAFNTAFVFNGYFTELECENAVDHPFVPSASVTLYAKYSNPAVLTIVYNDGTTENSVITYSVGDIVNVERPVYAKHIFLGWYTTAEFTEGTEWESGTAIEVDTTIYAKWDVAPIYNDTYGVVHFEFDESIANVSPIDSVSGVTFDEYGYCGNASYPFSGGVKITSYNAEEGTMSIEFDNEVFDAYIDNNTGMIIVDYTWYNNYYDRQQRELFLFTPFETGSDAKDHISSSYWGDGMCRAVEYTYDGTRYGIFIKNGQVYFGATFKSTNDFAAADNNVAGEECYLQDGLYVFDAEGNLLDQPNIEVTFDLGGNGENQSVTINTGFAVSLADRVPTYEGFIFRGWYTDSGFETLADDPFVTATAATLYAKWDEAVTLTYKYLDGTTPDLVVTDYYANDEVKTVQSVTFQFDGLVFAGWFTLDGSTTGEWGEQFVAGAVLTADTTVYAKWIDGYVMNGSYVGWNLYGTKSETKKVSGMTSKTTITANGEFSGFQLTSGVIDEQYKNVVDGVVMLGSKYAYYNHELGILWYSYRSNSTGVGTDTAFLIKADGLQSITYSSGVFSDMYVAWMTLNYGDGSTRNVFLCSNKIYVDVTLSDGVTVLNANKTDHSVYASDGSLIAIKTGSEVVGLDGYQGTYTGTLHGDVEATEVVIDGTGVATVGSVATTYVLEENVATIVLNNRMIKLALTLEGYTYSHVADGYEGTYTLPDQSTLTLDGYGMAGTSTYVVTGSTITLFTADGSTAYGIDVENKLLLGKSAFAGLTFEGEYFSEWDGYNTDLRIVFDDSTELTGVIYSGYGTSYYFNFTATFDGTTLVFTITKAVDSSAAGKTIEATLSGNTLTITKDYGSNIYTFENSGVLTCPELAVGGGEESETGVDGKTFNGTFNYLDWTSYESYPIDYSISFNADGTTGELVCDWVPYVIDGCNLTFTYTFDGTTVIMTITDGDLASAIGETVEATVDGNTMTVTKDFGSSEYDLEGTTATC